MDGRKYVIQEDFFYEKHKIEDRIASSISPLSLTCAPTRNGKADGRVFDTPRRTTDTGCATLTYTWHHPKVQNTSFVIVNSYLEAYSLFIFISFLVSIKPRVTHSKAQYRMINLRFAAYLMLIASSGVSAFTIPTTSTSPFSRAASSTTLQMSGNNLVVISPPGGVGEVAAVQAAKMGSSVRWFVISPSSSSGVSLSGPTLDSIAASDKNGSIELAGAQADTLLVPDGEEGSAIAAVSAWCGPNAHSDAGVICVYDGVDEAITAMNNALGAKPMDGGEIFKTKNAMMDAIKVAAKEATGGSSSGIKVAVLPFDMEFDGGDSDGDSDDGPGFLGSLLGGNKVQVPSSLNAAMGSKNVATLRYGELFGTPESSVRSLQCVCVCVCVAACIWVCHQITVLWNGAFLRNPSWID